MKNQRQSLLSKLSNLKTIFYKTLKINLEKDLKIERQNKEILLLKRNGCSCPCPTSTSHAEDTQSIQFLSFTQYFTSEELTVLRSIDNDPRHDTTFIRNVLSFLYKDDLKALQQKCLTGSEPKTLRKKNGETFQTIAKQPLTPKKVHILKSIHNERIKTVTKSEIDILRRTKERHINQMIAISLGNINRANRNG